MEIPNKHDIYNSVLYLYGFNDCNGYEDWESHMEQFFYYFPMILKQKCYYAELKLVGEVFGGGINRFLDRNCFQVHFVHGMLGIFFQIFYQNLLRIDNNVLRMKDKDSLLPNVLRSSVLLVKNFDTTFINTPRKVNIEFK